ARSGPLDLIDGEPRLHVLEPGGRLMLVADDKAERVRPSALRLQRPAELLALAPERRDEATHVLPGADDGTPPGNGDDDQGDKNENADDFPEVLLEERRRLGHRQYQPRRVVDEVRILGIDDFDPEPGGPGTRVLGNLHRERHIGRAA